jgi:hypothetical protein
VFDYIFSEDTIAGFQTQESVLQSLLLGKALPKYRID